MLTELGREYRDMRPRKTSGLKTDEVRKRIERWKAQVDRAQRSRKNTYWKTMGCWARRRKLLSSGLLDLAACLEVCFSMRAHVRYTSKRRSRIPRRIIDG